VAVIDILDMSPDARLGRMFNVAMSVARTEGIGLNLVNALREKYPDVTMADIGQVASMVGQGLKAAQAARTLGANENLSLDLIPVLPSVIFSTDEASRVIAFATAVFDVRSLVPDDNPVVFKEWDVRIECSEATTMEELMDCLEAEFGQAGRFAYEGEKYNFYREQSQIFFLGKRY